MEASLLSIDGLQYQYPNGHLALNQLTLNLGPGILGLLGPNGAGKSSLMRILATINAPTSGKVLWKGQNITQNPDALRSELGYLPQDFGIYPTLTAREFLGFLAAVKGLPRSIADDRVRDCLAKVGLADVADKQLGGFSGGMRQRVGIAQALLNDPHLLIVDEPTVGLDPEERLRFRHLLTDLAGDRLIILSTHIVSDVDASATQLAVMNKGRLRFFGTPEQLMAQADGHVWECEVSTEQLSRLREQFTITHSIRRPTNVLARVLAKEQPSSTARPCDASLEDAYMHLLAYE